LIGTPITANIIQTAKQTVNASVLAMATDHCFERSEVVELEGAGSEAAAWAMVVEAGWAGRKFAFTDEGFAQRLRFD
jgi:pyruvate/2-oxoacid:ferredoxin oxidoreductase alpha subunit